MDSQIVIPEAILVGNPGLNPLKSWMPDKVLGMTNRICESIISTFINQLEVSGKL
jgi:hypothetical protein